MRLLLIPILIASALLLSAEKSSAENRPPSPRPTPKGQTEQTERHDQTAQSSDTPSEPTALRAVVETPPLQTPTSGATPKGNNQESDYVGFGLAINGLLALATLILAIVGIHQARAARDAADAATSSAETARSALSYMRMSDALQQAIGKESLDIGKLNVEIAKLALNAERPYVLLEHPEVTSISDDRDQKSMIWRLSHSSEEEEPKDFGPPEKKYFGCSFRLRNCGKGPALIRSVAVRTVIGPGLVAALENKERWLQTIERQRGFFMSKRVLGFDAQEDVHIPFTFSIDQWIEIVGGEVTLLVVGLVRYRDVFKRSYTTTFCFNYSPPFDPGAFNIPVPERGWLHLHSEKHNRYT